MATPEVWLVGGPNGAGKTTFVQAHSVAGLFPHVRFLNPDDLARERLTAEGWRGFAEAPLVKQRAAFLHAARHVIQQVNEALSEGEAIGVETVLSTEKYQPVVERVRTTGGFVGLIYVGLESPELACRRVTRRVGEGGHPVPPEKIRNRWHRSLATLPWFVSRASMFWIFDNSDEKPDSPPLLVARGANGNLSFTVPSFPAWLCAPLAALRP